MQHFTVVAMPRSGSTRLCEILGRHPDVACHQEIFHPYEVQASLPRNADIMDRARRDADPAAFLDQFLDFAETCFRGRACHGFKVLLDSGQLAAATRIVCPSPRLGKIVLRRDNLLACYTSLRLAVETGVWQRTGDTPPDTGGDRLVFERKRFLAFAGQQLTAHAAIMASLLRSGHRVLALEYRETLTPQGFDQIWRFLGVPPRVDEGSLLKVNARPPLECYGNPDEVRETMLNLGRADWLAGDDAPGAAGG